MPSNFKCIIVDDQPSAIELLSDYIKEIPSLYIFKVYTNPLSALMEIKEEDEIDVALIDINMPEISGIDLASNLLNRVKHIIFTTGHPEYALQAFGVHAFDYLLKPIRQSTFVSCISAVMKIINSHELPLKSERLFIKGDLKGRYQSVKSENIIMIYTSAHYIVLETENGKYKTNETMRNVEIRLIKDSRFIRVHQSSIINIEKIISIDGNIIKLVNDWTVSVSENYKKNLLTVIQRNLLNIIY